MSYIFDCVLTGLCGFVLDKPLQATPPPSRCRVLLPEGDIGAFRERLSVHRPMLLIPTKNLRAGGGDPDFILQRSGFEASAIYFLDGLELSFDFHSEGVPANFVVDATKVANPEQPVASERTSFELIARLENGASSAKTLHASCLANAPSRDRVEARVRITEGNLHVRSVNQFKDPKTGKLVDEIWDFKDPGSGATIFGQVLAEDVVLEKSKVLSDIDLIFSNLDASGSLAFKVRVGPAVGESRVEITVLNAELEGLLDLQSFNPDSRLAADIKLIYRLSTAWDGVSLTAPVLPIPVRRLGGTGRPVNCPRASFVDDPSA